MVQKFVVVDGSSRGRRIKPRWLDILNGVAFTLLLPCMVRLVSESEAGHDHENYVNRHNHNENGDLNSKVCIQIDRLWIFEAVNISGTLMKLSRKSVKTTWLVNGILACGKGVSVAILFFLFWLRLGIFAEFVLVWIVSFEIWLVLQVRHLFISRLVSRHFNLFK